MTSVARELGREVGMDDFMDTVCAEFGSVYGREATGVGLDELNALIAGLDRPAEATLAEASA
jgi:hypothetical protein